MAAMQGATEAQIADALVQSLPHFTASLQDTRAVEQSEGTGAHTKQVKKEYDQNISTLTTFQAPTTQPALLAADVFAEALGTIPAEDWCRTWAAGRTIVLRRTSNRVKELVDKMRMPAVLSLSRSFWDDTRNGTSAEKLQFVLSQLTLTADSFWCRITRVELRRCEMKGQDVERLARVLTQCPALAHLNLSDNEIGDAGAESIAGVLGQCPALAHLNLCFNQIGPAGAERLAGVLAQCTALTHLNLGGNQIGDEGAESLAGVLPQCPALAHLNLCFNQIGPAGAERLAGVLAQCTSLTHLNLIGNQIGPAGAESLAEVLAHCPALAHLELSGNQIGPGGAERLARVLGQCPALAHLDLRYNQIGTAGQGRLRASWRGQASGLVL